MNRSKEKQLSREEDDRRLREGEISREELQKENSIWSQLNIDWANVKVEYE